MRSEAFGQIGIKPDDFYRMDWEDFFLLRKGFFEKRIYEQRLLRRITFIMVSPYMKQGMTEESLFEIFGDDEIRKQRSIISDETLKTLNSLKDGKTVWYKKDGKIYSKRIDG